MMGPTLAVTNVAKVEGKVNTGDTAEAAGELLRMRQSQARMAAATQPNSQGDSDVCTVVSKAKRAASSLWLLLHAQTCRLSSDQCPHTGCDDAKLILLHIKTCPAENCSECPVGYKGCQQSRKLLDHYRKCRDMRARQAGGSRRVQPHVCLVCSLVARQARNVLDGASKSTSPPTMAHKAASGSRKAMATFSLKQPPPDNTVMVPRLDSSELKPDMPPPPRRAPNGSEPVAIPGKKESDDADTHMDPCESPPSSYQLMRPGLAALAAAASPSLQEAKSAADASLLGKSLDSSKISFLLDASQSKATLPVSKSLTSPSRRPRSESVDVASVSRASHQPGTGAEEYDPTLESELTRDEADVASVDTPKKATRRRSASLGGLNSYQSSGSQCDTIVEETVTTDEPMFLMEEETDI